MPPKLDPQVKALFEEFTANDCQFESVTKWRNTLKGGTYEKYCLLDLAKYCLKFNINPDELVEKRIKAMTSTDPRIRSQAEDRVLGYHKELAKTVPGVAICAYRRVKSFYRANYVALQCRDPSYVIQREQDYLASKDETRKMCELLDLEGKAYLLTLAESCGRPGAVAKLRWKDIQEELHTNKLPIKIWLRHKVKVARNAYFTFICEDAKNALRLYVEGRDLKPADKVFQTQYSGLRKKIMNAAEQIGIYVNGNGKQPFRLHTYRKRGQTILEDSGVPLNWVDRILGHVPRGAQGKTYSLPPVEKLREKYTKAMSELTIYGTSQSTQVNGVSVEQLRQVLTTLMPEKAEEIEALLG